MRTTGKLKLTEHGDREIIITRIFNAPRSLVFDSFTKPEILRRWMFGPPGWELAICDIDLHVGGRYRYVWKNLKDGTTMASGGVYKELKVPEGFVGTERFDQPWYSGESIGTFDFEEHGGRTTLTLTLKYESKEARDTVLKSGMEYGLAMSYDRLDDVLSLEQLRKAA